ncbi:MAG: hypothetical protein R3C58_13865, partial [Parvularculaceae bacterium]
GRLDKRRFDALAGYARRPEIALIMDELVWFADRDERVLGMVVNDRIDHDFGWVVFGRDEIERYRAIDVNASHPTYEEAELALFAAMRSAIEGPPEFFHQGDAHRAPIDFFAPVVAEEKLNSSFSLLLNDKRYSPARGLIEAMMRSHEDLDGNFVEKFQTAGFDPQLWELYLWATFIELGYVQISDSPTPDFILRSMRGKLAIEATSANPPQNGGVPAPKTKAEFVDYLENYVPIRLGNALKRKLNHRPHYWTTPDAEGLPFCLAIQDFHKLGAMRQVVSAATEYVFGVRHSLVEGRLKVERLKRHKYGRKQVQSGFFKLKNAENISAVIVNPQGTLMKFNRIGFVAGFGDPNIKMTRKGVRRNDANAVAPGPTHFVHDIDLAYQEPWVEGMVVLHNPNARIPLDPELIPGAAHEFLQEDGRILSLLPEFHPLFSETGISVDQNG